jgi:mono/diheme cytochrome c family protein
MRYLARTIPVTLLLVVAASTGGVASAQEPHAPPDLATRVRSIFLAKCSECHGRTLSRPRAGLYLHELGQLAANREWVVPHEPENSYLWTLLRDDDMPAKGAKAGPLTAQEKEAVRAWIAAGAPVAPSQGAPLQSAPVAKSPPGALSASDGASRSRTAQLLGWVGRFHILAIHFPIALFAAAALAELQAARRGDAVPDPVVRFCVLLGAASAVATVALGWLHADAGGSGTQAPGVLTLHRWLGTAAGICAAAIALASERESWRGRRSLLFRIVLCAGTALVASAAHFGGLLVHGRRFFDWP